MRGPAAMEFRTDHRPPRLRVTHPVAVLEKNAPTSMPLYVTNLTDKNAIIYTNTGNFDLRYTTNEPRVIGVRLSYRFGKATVE